MTNNRKTAQSYLNNCAPCFDTNQNGTMLPEQNMVKCNTRTCYSYVNNNNELDNIKNFNN